MQGFGKGYHPANTCTTLDDTIISQHSTHNHERDEAEIERETIVANMKLKAMETTRPIPATGIYHDEIQKIVTLNKKMMLLQRCLRLNKTALYHGR